MAKKVLYIKIARIDQNGNDLTNTLESLTQITIPYTTSGNKTYKILTRADFPTYYLFQVDLDNSPDAVTQPNTTPTTLNYEIASPINDFATGSYNTVGRYKNKSATGGQTLTDFYNSDSQRIEINTIPKKDLHFIIGGENPGIGNTFEATLTTGGVGIAQTASVELYQSSAPYTTFTKLTSNPGKYLTTANPTVTLGTLSVSIPKENLSPGDIIFLGVAPDGTLGAGANLAQVQLSNPGGAKFTRKLHVTSSAAAGPELENIVEPYLAKKFTNSDCDVLINNADQYQDNPFLQDIDFSSGAIVPINYEQIVAGTAQKATVPESMFTMGGMVNPNNSAVNQVDKFNISASSYFGQTSGGTFVAYYDVSQTSGTAGTGFTTRFYTKYLITPDEEAIEITPDDSMLDLLKRNFGSSANPLDREYYPFGPLEGEIRTKATAISGSTGTAALEYRGNTKVFLDGSSIIVEVKTSGSSSPGSNNYSGGIVYPSSIKITSHSELPSKAREILTRNNIIAPSGTTP